MARLRMLCGVECTLSNVTHASTASSDAVKGLNNLSHMEIRKIRFRSK